MKSYLAQVKNLYGKTSDMTKPKRKRKRKRYHEEEIEQMKLALWLVENRIPFYHIPNQGKRSLWEGSKLRAMGLTKGVPDLCIPMASKGSNSLYIELKTKSRGVLTIDQKNWLNRLNSLGSKAVVCYGCDDAINMVKNYLKN